MIYRWWLDVFLVVELLLCLREISVKKERNDDKALWSGLINHWLPLRNDEPGYVWRGYVTRKPRLDQTFGEKKLSVAQDVHVEVAGKWREPRYFADTDILGGGFKYFLFSPIPREMIQVD